MSQPANGGGNSNSSSMKGRDWGAPVLVLGVWALMWFTLVWFVWTYSVNTPWADELHLVPVVTGNEPLTWAWLWTPFVEHRIPLTRLAVIGLIKATGNNFRAPMFASVFVLGLLTLALIGGAWRARGGLRYTDALFPLAFLNLGNSELLVESMGLQFFLVTLLACVLLLIIVRQGETITAGQVVGAALCLFLLPLNGAAGLAFVPPMALWLAYAGARGWQRSPEDAPPRPRLLGVPVWPAFGPAEGAAWHPAIGLAAVVLAVAAIAVVPLYFLNVPTPANAPPPSPSVWASLDGSAKFLGQLLGPAAQDSWPIWKSSAPGSKKSAWPVAVVIALALLLFGAVLLVVAWIRQPAERGRAAGLLCFLGAIGALALGLGWGRAGVGPESCFAARYAAFASPGLACLYFAGLLYFPRRAGRLLQVIPFALACLFCPGNWQKGLGVGQDLHGLLNAFREDVTAGVPLELLDERYTESLLNISWDGKPFPGQHEQVREALRQLKQARISFFKQLQELPPHREIPIPLETALSPVSPWEKDGHWYGGDTLLDIALEKPLFVYGLRVMCTTDFEGGTPAPIDLALSWKAGDEQKEQRLTLDPQRGPKTATFWVNERVEQARLGRDPKPGTVKFEALQWLVPTAERRPETTEAGYGKQR